MEPNSKTKRIAMIGGRSFANRYPVIGKDGDLYYPSAFEDRRERLSKLLKEDENCVNHISIVDPGHNCSHLIMDELMRQQPEIKVVNLEENKRGVRITYSGLVSTPTITEFEFTLRKKFEEPWIDPHAVIFNDKKHRETCTKNRKKRKAKRKNNILKS